MAVQAILYGLAPTQYPIAVRGIGVGTAVAAGRLGSVASPLFAGMLVAAGQTSGQIMARIVPMAIIGGVATLLLLATARKTGIDDAPDLYPVEP